MTNHIYLAHHGIKGMKWGVRRFRNEDGTLTEAGKQRYGEDSSEKNLRQKAETFYREHESQIKVGAAVVGASLAVYGAYKLYQHAPIKQYGALTYDKSDPLSTTLDSYSKLVPSVPSSVKLHRISRDAIADYSEVGSTYVSYKFRDNARYVSAAAKEFQFPGGERKFVHEFSPNREIRVPSSRTLAELYLKQHPNATDQQFRYVVTHGFIQWDAETMSDPVMRHAVKAANEFKETLLSNGYDAIVDLEDAGRVGTELPLILLNPSDISVSARRITGAERVIASLVQRK